MKKDYYDKKKTEDIKYCEDKKKENIKYDEDEIKEKYYDEIKI